MALAKPKREKSIFASEIEKLKKQQVFSLLFVFVIIKILLTVTSGYTTHYIIEQNMDVYKKYMHKYEGKITQKKEEEMKQEYESIYFADAFINEYAQQLEEGKITKSEYQAKCENYYERLKEKKAFEVFYSKYTYAKEDPENRYLLDTRGWETLLKDDFDYLLLFALVVIVSVIFTQETEGDMEDILLSSKNGGKKLITAKLKTGIGIGMILFFIFQIIKLVYLLNVVGLEGIDYPLKSISSFETSKFNVSLGQAYIGVIIVQMLGTIFAVIQILWIALCFKKVIPSMVISIFVLLLPNLLENTGFINFLPFPFVMLKAVSFIQGNLYVGSTLSADAVGEERNMVEAMSMGKSFLILGIQMIYIVVFVILIYKKYLHNSLHNQRHWYTEKKKKWGVSLFLIFIVMVSGCKKEEKEYNQPEIFEEESTEIKVDNCVFRLDKEQSLLIMTDTRNNRSEILSRDVYDDDRKITAFYATENSCYYLKENQTDSGIQLWEISLSNRNEKIIYDSCRKNKQDFYGFVKSENEIEEIFDSIETSESLFLYQGIYAFWRKDTDLYRLDLGSKIQKKFVEDMKEGTYYIVKKDTIFYINSSYQICIKNLITGQSETLSIYGRHLEVKNESIYYQDLLHKGEIRKLKSFGSFYLND